MRRATLLLTLVGVVIGAPASGANFKFKNGNGGATVIAFTLASTGQLTVTASWPKNSDQDLLLSCLGTGAAISDATEQKFEIMSVGVGVIGACSVTVSSFRGASGKGLLNIKGAPDPQS